MDKEKRAVQIIDRLIAGGHQAVLAGGCVRDRLRGVPPKDYDIATSAKPEQVQKLFNKTIPVGAAFGVIIVMEENDAFEVATFRHDGPYKDGRHPESVSFGSLEEDALRRDFTVNGLFFDTKKNQILDFVKGEDDLKKKLIRAIGDPKKRFEEDHLRMLRAIRFAVQLEFEIDPPTLKVIKELAPLLAKVSKERIRDEFSKILTSSNPARGVRLLDETRLIEHIIPEVDTLKGVEQPMEFHPEGDVWIHTLMLLENLKHPELELGLGALLHDIAKPETFVRAADRIRFHGHDLIGAEKSEKILKRLCYSNEQTDLVVSLVREHLRFKDAFNMRVATLKRFLSLERFDLHLGLHRVDCLASHGDLRAHQFCTEKYEEFKKLPPPPLRLVTGNDLIKMGLKPSPQFSEILRKVEDAILEGTVSTKEQGLELVKTLLAEETK